MKNILIFVLSAFILSCNSSNYSKKTIIIVNNTNLNTNSFQSFDCCGHPKYLNKKICNSKYLRTKKFIENTNDNQFILLSVKKIINDSILFNIEELKIMKDKDTIRISNYGENIIPLENFEIQIKRTLCRFTNK